MTRIALINMPFSDWYRPSFALSQLSALTRREFGAEVAVEIRYLNVDIAEYLGPAVYDMVADELEHLLTGVGEWFFRQVAFPETEDNAEEFFLRYYAGSRWEGFRDLLLACRAGLADFCEELIDRYALANADIVGFTSMFAQNVPSMALARLIKARDSSVVTIMGGANCEFPMGAVFARAVPAIDYVFSGPALHSFPDFVRRIRAGDLASIPAIPGILTAQDSKGALPGAVVGRERDIDDFIEPDYREFLATFAARRDRLTDKPDMKPILFFETSRGCWWGQRSHCTFCGLNGASMGYRAMAPDTAVRQFETLFRHAPECQEFVCTDNIMPKNYPKEVFPRLATPPGVSLFYEVKLPLSERDLGTMRRAGVTRVQPGIEALATSTLKLMGKGTTSFLNIQFLKACVAYDITPAWNLLLGFPGEAEEVYAGYTRDIPLIRHLHPPYGASMVRFDRFSPYFAKAEDYGLDLEPMDHYELVYPFDRQQLEQLAYFFADGSFAPYMVAASTWYRPISQLVERWIAAWRTGDRPRLDLHRDQNGELWIHDSRGERARRYQIDEPTFRTLLRLSSPVRVDRFAQEVRLDPHQAAAQLEFLRQHDLLFTDMDRVMSLVVLDAALTPAEAEEDLVQESLPFIPLDAVGR